MSNIGNYDEKRESFSWDAAKEVLGWEQGELLNIGAICSDRVCARGHADRIALIWEGFGDRKATYTFGDLKVFSNGIAQMLVDQGIAPGDRVCLFMDKIPSLYFAFLGVLKMGGWAPHEIITCVGINPRTGIAFAYYVNERRVSREVAEAGLAAWRRSKRGGEPPAPESSV